MKLLAFLISACAFGQTLPNAVPMPSSVVQFVDSNGVPLAGGKLYTCAAGGSCTLTTPPSVARATYTTSAANVQNTNPIILDSAGRAQVWIGANAYKLVLTDANGVQQWTQDNVSDTTLYFVNYVKTAGTATLISFDPPNSQPQTTVQAALAAKFNQTKNVEDFGAVCDGTTNNTTAFNAAVAALPNGGTLLIGANNPTNPCTFLLPTGVAITQNIYLRCSSPNVTLKATTDGASQDVPLTVRYVVKMTNLTAGGVSNCRIESNYPTASNIWGILVNASSGLTFQGNVFHNIGGSAISLLNVSQAWIQDNTFTSVGLSGVRLELPDPASNNNIWIQRNYLSGMNMKATAGYGSIQSYGSTQTSPLPQTNIWVSDNRVLSSGTVGIGMDRCDYCAIDGNSTSAQPGEGIAFTGSHVSVYRNRTTGSSASSGIMFFAVNDYATDFNTIEDNLAWDNSGQGIAIVWGCVGATTFCPLPITLEIKNLQITRNRTWSDGLGITQTIGIQGYCLNLTPSPGICAGAAASWTNVLITLNDGAFNTQFAQNFQSTVTATNVIDQNNLDSPGYLSTVSPMTITSSVALPNGPYNVNLQSFGSGNQAAGINFLNEGQFHGSSGFTGQGQGSVCSLPLSTSCTSSGVGAFTLALVAPAKSETISFWMPQQSPTGSTTVGGISISSITSANPAVMTVASVPATVVAGSYISIVGLTTTSCTAAPVHLNSAFWVDQLVKVTNVSGTDLTLDLNTSGCVFGGTGTYSALTLMGMIDPRGRIPSAIRFAQLDPTSTLPFENWCSDCTVNTTPPYTCAGAGTGAWAFKSGASGVWKCPF